MLEVNWTFFSEQSFKLTNEVKVWKWFFMFGNLIIINGNIFRKQLLTLFIYTIIWCFQTDIDTKTIMAYIPIVILHYLAKIIWLKNSLCFDNNKDLECVLNLLWDKNENFVVPLPKCRFFNRFHIVLKNSIFLSALRHHH